MGENCTYGKTFDYACQKIRIRYWWYWYIHIYISFIVWKVKRQINFYESAYSNLLKLKGRKDTRRQQSNIDSNISNNHFLPAPSPRLAPAPAHATCPLPPPTMTQASARRVFRPRDPHRHSLLAPRPRILPGRPQTACTTPPVVTARSPLSNQHQCRRRVSRHPCWATATRYCIM